MSIGQSTSRANVRSCDANDDGAPKRTNVTSVGSMCSPVYGLRVAKTNASGARKPWRSTLSRTSGATAWANSFGAGGHLTPSEYSDELKFHAAIARTRLPFAKPMPTFDEKLADMRRWFEHPRFAGIRRLYTPREVVEQRGTIRDEHAVARDTAFAFHERLRQLFVEKQCMTSFGPYSQGEAVAMKRMGLEGIYVGGWATSAKRSADEDPGPDLASYPLSRVPDEARAIVRALLTADRNEYHSRLRMTEAQRTAT